MSEYGEFEFKFVRSFVICKNTGEYLIDYILDSDINPVMISSFVSALSMFGKENMGKIEEISVKGIDVEMTIVSKHNLILIVLMDRDFHKEIIREEGERILDLFYAQYKDDLEDCSVISKFSDFKPTLFSEVQACLDRMNRLEDKPNTLRTELNGY